MAGRDLWWAARTSGAVGGRREEEGSAGELLRPAEAAARLGMPPSTLRLYATKFAEFLSPAAASPPVSPDGRPAPRLYTAQDLALLARAKELLARGLTYDQARQALRQLAGLEPRAAPTPVAADLERALAAWRALAEERTEEVRHLRAELQTLRESERLLRQTLAERLAALEARLTALERELTTRLARLEQRRADRSFTD